jgi:PAS domain S-box-containing protein
MADSKLTSEALSRAVLDSIGIPIVAATAAGIIVVFNAAAEKLFGHVASEIVGHLPLARLVEGEHVGSLARALSAQLGAPIEPGVETLVALAGSTAGEPTHWTCRAADGSALQVSLTVKALDDARGERLGFVAFPVARGAASSPERAARSCPVPHRVAPGSKVADPSAPFDSEEVCHRLSGNVTLLVEVVALFERERVTLLDALQRAVAERQTEVIERVAHKLRGALLNLAAGPAAGAAGAVEDVARRGQAPTPEQLGTLLAELDRLSTALVAFRDEQAAP